MKKPMSKKRFSQVERDLARNEVLLFAALYTLIAVLALYISSAHQMREEVKRWHTATATGRAASAASAASPPDTRSGAAGDAGGS